MPLFSSVVREDLEKVLLDNSHDMFDESTLSEVKRCVIEIIGIHRTPAVDDDWDEWLKRVITSELLERELIALYIKLLEKSIVHLEFSEQVNAVLEMENYRLFHHSDSDRWWFVDEGIEAIAYSVYEAVGLVQAHSLNEVDDALKQAEEKRRMAEWEYVVWKCSKAVEATARYCLRKKMHQANRTPPSRMPEMGRCYSQLRDDYNFWNDDAPLARLYETIRATFRNPTAHLDASNSRPPTERNCDNEEDGNLAFVMSHLVIYQMLKRL